MGSRESERAGASGLLLLDSLYTSVVLRGLSQKASMFASEGDTVSTWRNTRMGHNSALPVGGYSLLWHYACVRCTLCRRGT